MQIQVEWFRLQVNSTSASLTFIFSVLSHIIKYNIWNLQNAYLDCKFPKGVIFALKLGYFYNLII